jgi:hypothetical protein
VLHVAGTNGKGSLCALLAAALSAHGARVAAFTSPFLREPRDAFTVDGAPVARAAWEGALAALGEATAAALEQQAEAHAAGLARSLGSLEARASSESELLSGLSASVDQLLLRREWQQRLSPAPSPERRAAGPHPRPGERRTQPSASRGRWRAAAWASSPP